MNFALVFLAYVVLDFVFARYTRAVTDQQRVAASAWSMAIVFLTGYITVSYVSDWRMLFPAAAGAFVGTFIGVKKKGN